MDLDMDIHKFISYAIIGVVIIGFTILIGAAIKYREFRFIEAHPLLFLIETLLVAICPALPVFFFVMSRGMAIDTATIFAGGLAVKFFFFHVLCEISGYYKSLRI